MAHHHYDGGPLIEDTMNLFNARGTVTFEFTPLGKFNCVTKTITDWVVLQHRGIIHSDNTTNDVRIIIIECELKGIYKTLDTFMEMKFVKSVTVTKEYNLGH